LADHHVPSSAVAGLADSLSQIAWSDDHEADVRRCISVLEAPAEAPATLPAVRRAIDEHFGYSSVRGIVESLEHEARPEFAAWAAQTAALMRSRSPTMLCVTLSQLARGAEMSLADCFRMELGMAAHSFVQGDFLEGVRAVLIDKDNSPRWQPGRIEDVSEESVAAFFAAC
jgi:enoyl-CoA hydratase/carnithine racemase